MANSKSNRKPGRPKKRETPCTPEVIEKIGRLFLKGKTNLQIAEAIGVTENAIAHHLNHTIKPLWRNGISWDASVEMARADEVIRMAFEGYDRSCEQSTKTREKYSTEAQKSAIKKKAPRAANKERLVERTLEKIERDGDKGWLELVHLMMDFKAKVKGGYAPARLNVQQQTELRLAGMTPAQLDQSMLERAAELIVQRRRHQQVLDDAARAAGVSSN